MAGKYGEEIYRIVEYWADIGAFEPYKCLCYAENNGCNLSTANVVMTSSHQSQMTLHNN